MQKQVEYDYDVFDRRIQKRVDVDGNGAFDRAEKFVYDGSDVVLVFDESSSLTTRFLHGPAVDQVFASEDALAQVLWGLPDNQGTVRDWVEYDEGTDTTSVVNHLKFDAFGQITAVEDGAGNPSTLNSQPSSTLIRGERGTRTPNSTTTALAGTTRPLGASFRRTPPASPPATPI